MNVSLITVGKVKRNGGFADMSAFYEKRLARYVKCDVVELKERASIAEESKSIRQTLLSRTGVTVALREDGKRLSTEAFASFVASTRNAGQNLIFVIGGAYGFEKIGEQLSLSIAPWTLPHQLARIVLLEQLYRVFSLLAGSAYHHG